MHRAALQNASAGTECALLVALYASIDRADHFCPSSMIVGIAGDRTADRHFEFLSPIITAKQK